VKQESVNVVLEPLDRMMQCLSLWASTEPISAAHVIPSLCMCWCHDDPHIRLVQKDSLESRAAMLTRYAKEFVVAVKC
jgi:hypothetical protein